MPLVAAVEPLLLGIVDKVTARSIRTEANGVISSAQLRFVLGMTAQSPELTSPMSKLTLGAIFAGAAFMKSAAQLSLVAGGRLS